MPDMKIIPIPEHAHGEIRLLFNKTTLTRPKIAEFCTELLFATERRRRETERAFWYALKSFIPEINEYTSVKYDIKTRRVIEVDSENNETGKSVEVPRERYREVMLLLEEMDIVDSSKQLIADVATGIDASAQSHVKRLYDAISHYIPETSEGSWELDLQRMAMIKVPDEALDSDQKPEAD